MTEISLEHNTLQSDSLIEVSLLGESSLGELATRRFYAMMHRYEGDEGRLVAKARLVEAPPLDPVVAFRLVTAEELTCKTSWS